jgi:hypothetical protein
MPSQKHVGAASAFNFFNLKLAQNGLTGKKN